MPRRTRTSLRFKLIIWMIVIWALIQGTLTSVIWLYERQSVNALFDDRLRLVATKIAAEVADIPPPLSGRELESVAKRYAGAGLFDHIVLFVYGPDRTIVAAMDQPAPDDEPADPQLFAQLEKGTVIESGALPHPLMGEVESRARTLARSLPGERYPGHLLVVVAEEVHSNQLRHRFTELLIGAFLAGLLGVAVGAVLVSGIITAPITRLLKTLQDISPDTLKDTVPSEGESHELASVRRELEAARNRIERGFMHQERFISNAAHELSTPIATLLTDAQTLPQFEHAPPEMKAFIKHVIRELRQLGGTIEGFLLLTRVREGRLLDSSTTDYPVNELLIDCVESCTPMARLHNVPISVTMLSHDDELDLMVCGVPELLRTMLANLVRNAIRFTRPGTAVELAAERQGPDKVRLSVRDYGPGIPPSMLNHLFDRFSPSDPEGHPGRGRSHGLGLAIAQGIAELHEGTIAVENCEDRGCRFTVLLPLAQPQSDCPDLDLNAANG